MTIDGQSTGGPHAVPLFPNRVVVDHRDPGRGEGFHRGLDTGDTVTAQSVDFRDFGGFTGTYWKGDIGDAEVSGAGGKYTINGSADGSFTDNPSNAVTATFRIEADC